MGVDSISHLLIDSLLALVVCGWLLLTGIGALRLLTSRFQGLQLVCYGVGVGILANGLVGLIVAAVGWQPRLVAAVLLSASTIGSLWIWSRRRIVQELRASLGWMDRTAVLAWVAFACLCVGITHLNIQFPPVLFDGPYVFKNHRLHVKIQTMTGHLPADNYIPYVVCEFLLRGISFKAERPLCPGQEVSNRTVLMALAAVPWRAVVEPPPRQEGPLGTFEYVGTQWPDVEQLGKDKYFRQFLVVGIVLNATLLLGASLLFKNHSSDKLLGIGILLLVSNPYVISQTIFTWPKALAAFFILLAIDAFVREKSPVLGAFFLALAYHSHPYAIVFAASFGLYLICQALGRRALWKDAVLYIVVFALLVAPWFVWTRVVLRIPSEMMQQNFQWGNSLDSVWVRIHNLYELFSFRQLEAFPFHRDEFVQTSLICFPGMVGMIFVLPGYLGLVKFFSQQRFLILFAVLAPTIVVVSIFGYIAAVPALHGMQAVTPILMFLALKFMLESRARRMVWLLLVTQIVINLAMLAARAEVLGIFGPTTATSWLH
jgi:hypothetical protein